MAVPKQLTRRGFLGASAFAAAGALLAACGQPAPQPTAAPAAPAATAKPAQQAASTPAAAAPKPAQKSVSLRFTTWWAPMEAHLAVIKQKFEAANPGVTVTPEFISSEFVPKMEASLVAGTWGDASIIENSVQVRFMDAGLHLDMTDRTKRDNMNLRDDWELMGLEIWEGKVLCMPFDNDPRGIYYNKTAFKESGAKDPWDDLKGQWTWADMEDAARKTTVKDASGKITRYGLQWNYAHYQEFSPFVWTMGGNYADWTTLKYTLEDPAMVKSQEMLLRWAKQDKILITKEGINEMMGASGANPFRSGVAAMYHRAAYEVNIMADAIRDKFEWDVAPFPDMDKDHPGAPVTSGNPNFVPAKTKYPDEAYEWVRTLASDETQKYFAEKKVFVPANKRAWKTYQTTTPPKHAESFIRWVYGRPHGFHFYNAGMADAGRAAEAELDLVYLDKKPLLQALKDANKKANEFVNFGSAKDPFPFKVPKPRDKNLAKWEIE